MQPKNNYGRCGCALCPSRDAVIKGTLFRQHMRQKYATKTVLTKPDRSFRTIASGHPLSSPSSSRPRPAPYILSAPHVVGSLTFASPSTDQSICDEAFDRSGQDSEIFVTKSTDGAFRVEQDDSDDIGLADDEADTNEGVEEEAWDEGEVARREARDVIGLLQTLGLEVEEEDILNRSRTPSSSPEPIVREIDLSETVNGRDLPCV